MRILFLANWHRTSFTPGQGYAFFAHMDPRPDLIFLGTGNLPLWTAFEKRLLRFYPIQAIRAVSFSREADLVVAYSSQSGLPFAFLKSLLRLRVPLVVFDIECMGRKTGPALRLIRIAADAIDRSEEILRGPPPIPASQDTVHSPGDRASEAGAPGRTSRDGRIHTGSGPPGKRVQGLGVPGVRVQKALQPAPSRGLRPGAADTAGGRRATASWHRA